EAAVGGNTSPATTDHTTALTISGVADTPLITAAAAASTTENTAVKLTGLSLQPGDSSANDAADTYTVTLSVGHGSLSLTSATGLTFLNNVSSGASITFSGSLADVQAALADNNITYNPTGEYEGSDTLHFTATSTEEAAVGGNTSPATTDHTTALTISGVADTPLITAAAAASTTENTAVKLTGLSLQPGDSSANDAADTYTVTLSVGHGSLSLTSATGLTFLNNVSSGASITFSGSLADVQAALADNNITYNPTGEYEGSDTLHFTATSTEEAAVGGNTSPATTDHTTALTISGVADTPLITAAAA